MDAQHGLDAHLPAPGLRPIGRLPYRIPYTIVNRKHRLVRISFHYASESDRGPYPFGPGTQIEGGKNAGGDRHAIMVNKQTCVLYELFNARYSKHPTAGLGAIWNLRSNALRPAGWTSADAAGLPILPGLLNYQQVAYSARTGKPITHAAFPQWPDALVSLLKGIPARAFEAVNTSCLMVSPNSGAVKAKRGCRIG